MNKDKIEGRQPVRVSPRWQPKTREKATADRTRSNKEMPTKPRQQEFGEHLRAEVWESTQGGSQDLGWAASTGQGERWRIFPKTEPSLEKVTSFRASASVHTQDLLCSTVTRLAQRPDRQLTSWGETTGGWMGERTTEMVSKVNRILDSSKTNLKIMITMFYKLVENTEIQQKTEIYNETMHCSWRGRGPNLTLALTGQRSTEISPAGGHSLNRTRKKRIISKVTGAGVKPQYQ